MLKGLAKADAHHYELSSAITVDELKAMLKRDFPGLRDVLDSRSILISINQEFASKDSIVKDNDEVGLLPPFSGG